METKYCRKCGQTKPLSEFSLNAKSKDGHQTYCKECIMEYHRSRKKEYQRSLKKKSEKPVFYLGLSSFNLLEAEKELIKSCMREYPGLTMFEMAEKLGVSERTIQAKLEDHRIKKPGVPLGKETSLPRTTSRRSLRTVLTGRYLRNFGTEDMMVISLSM